MFHQADPERLYTPPRRAYQGDAGYDLFACVDMMLEPGTTKLVPTNVRVDFPPGWFGLIQERSSQGKAGIMTLGNVIDEGYTAGIGCILHNTTKMAVIVHQGEKVGQLVLVPRFIDPTEHTLPVRATNGFGSSGAK